MYKLRVADLDLRPYADTRKDSAFTAPFTLVDAKGKVWNCVSNFKYLLAVRGRGRYRRWAGSGEDLGTMLRFLHSLPEQSTKLKVADLIEWAEPSRKGEGRILGVVVPLDQTIKLLETCPLKTVEVWRPGEAVAGDDRALGWRAGEGWLVIQMGCKTAPEGLPAFETGDEEPVDGLALMDLIPAD